VKVLKVCVYVPSTSRHYYNLDQDTCGAVTRVLKKKSELMERERDK